MYPLRVALEDAPAQTRRALRQRAEEPMDAVGGIPATEAVLTLEPEPAPASPAPEPAADEAAPVAGRRIAFAWVDEASLGRAFGPVEDLSTAATPYVPVETDLLADPPRRSLLRPGVVVPTAIVAGLVGVYAAGTLLWPLNAVAPTVTAIQVQPLPAAAATPAWPKVGSAAVSVGGIDGAVSSTKNPSSMASITKVVTALAVLDEMPLKVGEQGRDFAFTYSDELNYWNTLSHGESALDVPVGGTLSEYQLLEGMLIGSAGNYAERLAGNLWPSDAVYANAANGWLRTHGVTGVTVVEPTGMDTGNVASPAALLTLAKKALANPVIAEIVAKKAVDLPGAGHVENTNGLLADAGVVGIKTGTLVAWNLLSAKDVQIGDKTVRLYASVLDQPDDKARINASRALYTQLEAELQVEPSVTSGTTAGVVDTLWGESVDVVTGSDASVILWNGGSGSVSTTYSLGDRRDKGDVVGSLSVAGPLDSTKVDLRLEHDVEGPSAWWRLTHPLQLLGLSD
jgi:D-alanyl-D-alanine carboxypeptidase (penicillin-binding protein 5/6)